MLSTFESVAVAVTRLRAGDLVAMPTETVYGLAANACADDAVAKIYTLKGRPSHNPLIVHVASAEMAQRYVVWNDLAQKLADAHWPGPLTLVLPLRKGSGISSSCTSGGDTLGVRLPAHPIARAVIEGFGGGLAAPSANRSGRISPTLAEHVRAEFPGGDLLILDGGPAQVGLESTVVDCTGPEPVVLRPGSISIVSSGHRVIGSSGILQSPGLLASHYAPGAPVRLNATDVAADEMLLAFGPNPLPGAKHTLNLSESGDLAEAAANLFAMLRALDNDEGATIAVMPVPHDGIGQAINDRLARAAVR